MTIFLTSQCFSGEDDGVSTYYYNGMPGCGCFYHCNCLIYKESDHDDHDDDDDFAIEDKIWHEFMKKYFSAKSIGPFFYEPAFWDASDFYYVLKGCNPGKFICLLNEYLDVSTRLTKRLEIARKANIARYRREYDKPRDREILITKINQENSRMVLANEILSAIPGTVVPLCKKLIEDCPHTGSYNMVLVYNRGLTSFLEVDIAGSLTDIITFIDQANLNGQQRLLTSEFLQKQGEAYFEVGLYHESIDALNKAIAKNPNNLDAFFQRASSYFETGNFDQALSDYIHSKPSDHFNPYVLPPNEFIDAFSEAAFQGAGNALEEFVPSLCHTIYGLGDCLWTCGQCPVESMQNLASASYEMGKQVVDYLKTVDKEKLSLYADEIVQLYDNYNQLSDREKGNLIGYAMGKYGVDIFATSSILKGVSAYRQVKKANTICNFETMIANESTKQSIISRSLERETRRATFFEKPKIHWDRQYKHVPGKHNYIEGKSILEHKDPEGLLKKYAGKGTRKQGKFGEPGYQEVVDFKEHVGIWRSRYDKTDLRRTTKGTIHHSKDGAHIVPEDPNYKIWR